MSQPCVMTAELDPVCGSDGNNYSSPSHAACFGVTSFQRGKCPSDTDIKVDFPTPLMTRPTPQVDFPTPLMTRPNPNCVVSRESLPVCGSDGRTYRNPSAIRCARVNSYTYGPCKRQNRPCVATMDYSPVCGTNGKTYDNVSIARCAGVTEFVDGPCPWSK